MSKSKKLGVIKSIAILVIICLVTSGALAVVNSYPSPVIQAAAEERENQARQSVMPDATDFEQLDVKNLPDGVVSVYQGKDSSGATAGYVFTVEGKGFGGTIQVFVPQAMVEDYRRGIDAVLGEGACHLLSIRPVGGIELVPASAN